MQITNVLLRGIASPNGLPAKAWFEWGEGTNYDHQTPVRDLPESYHLEHVTHVLENLSPTSHYLARLVVTNELGIARGPGQFLNLGGYAVCFGNDSGAPEQNDTIREGLYYADLSAGSSHNLLLDRSGRLSIFGKFRKTPAATIPAFIPPDLTNVIAIASGANHCLALRDDGTVVSWGGPHPSNGQTNVPADLANVVAIAGGGAHSLALRADGTVVSWGILTAVPASATKVVAIAAGSAHCMALRNDGKVVCWNVQAQRIAGLTNIVGIAAGGNQSLALGSDGAYQLAASGLVFGSRLSSNIVAMAAGQSHHLLLRADGSVLGVGSNPFGQTTIPAALGIITGVAAGESHSALLCGQPAGPKAWPPAADLIRSTSARLGGFLSPNGLASVAWFDWGQLGQGYSQSTAPVKVASQARVFHHRATLSNLAPGAFYQCRLAVSNELGVVYSTQARFTTGSKLTMWGQNDLSAMHVPAGLHNVVLADGGAGHTIALTSDGVVHAWGLNDRGQASVPADLSNVANVGAGVWHSLALHADGTVSVWGDSQAGVTNVPPGLSNVVQAVAGGWHVGALRNDGSLLVWGGISPFAGSLTNFPLAAVDLVSISTSGDHMLALRRDGKVFSWGYDLLVGSHTVPLQVTNVIAIYAGVAHNLALRDDSTVAAWGYAGPPRADLTNVISVAGGWYHSLALKHDGTIATWAGPCCPAAAPPTGFTNGVFLACGDEFSLALGPDLHAVAYSESFTGPMNADSVISLPGCDPNGDPFAFRILSAPASGTLYQFTENGRGARLNANEPVTDEQGRVTFVPAIDAFGVPYDSFSFVANDGLADSLPASLTVHIVPAPVIDPGIASLNAAGSFSLQFKALPDAGYRVWASTNLIHWTMLGAATSTSPGIFEFTDTAAKPLPRRFYRVTCP
ncbi:MAG TPA: hypothetical protein VN673_12550 [Clostridia bacterium]|nr:hypothetical protein [Clostridia bacterium]